MVPSFSRLNLCDKEPENDRLLILRCSKMDRFDPIFLNMQLLPNLFIPIGAIKIAGITPIAIFVNGFLGLLKFIAIAIILPAYRG